MATISFFHPFGVEAQVALHSTRFHSHPLCAGSMLFVNNLVAVGLYAGGPGHNHG